MKLFEQLGLREDILASIKKIGFYEPTKIQEKSIPLILKGEDVIAMSNTGSGKTFAFGAGIIQQVHPQAGVQAIILVPTRELAEQMNQTFKSFCKETRIRITTIYGGVAIGPQFKALKQAEIVIGTPGRTLDHLERGSLKLDRVNHFVLDEADRMLDMGFLPDIKKIMKNCPEDRQILLFSATMPGEIKKLAQQFMHEPAQINLAEQVDPSKLQQETYMVHHKYKRDILIDLIQQEGEKELVIVFCNTRAEVDNTTKKFKQAGIKATAIHGGLSQAQRLRVIKAFNSRNNTNILVCTDVAARGLDIPGVTHVYNYDIPRESKQYIHRIGRTARAGADGKAINIVSPRDLGNYRQVLRENKLTIQITNTPLPEQQLSPSEQEQIIKEPARRTGGARGRRGNSKGFGRKPARKSFNKEGSSERAPKKSFSDKKPRRENMSEKPAKKSFGKEGNNERGPKKGFGKKKPAGKSFGRKPTGGNKKFKRR